LCSAVEAPRGTGGKAKRLRPRGSIGFDRGIAAEIGLTGGVDLAILVDMVVVLLE